MPGHVGTDIIVNSLRARGLPEPGHMSDAQVEELIPRNARGGLISAGMLADGASADDLRQVLTRLTTTPSSPGWRRSSQRRPEPRNSFR